MSNIIYINLDVGLKNKNICFYVESQIQVEQIKDFAKKYDYRVTTEQLFKLDTNQLETLVEKHILSLMKSKTELMALNDQLDEELKSYNKKKKELKDNSKNNKKVKIKKVSESDSD